MFGVALQVYISAFTQTHLIRLGGAMQLNKTPRTVLMLTILLSSACANTVAQHQGYGNNENVVTHWNSVALELMVDPGGIIETRAFAIFHAAIHDAVNGVDRRYKPYTADVSSPGASVEAAVATAAHDVLISLSPSQRDKIEAEYIAALAAIPDGPAKIAGVALGRKCAQANLDRRANDGVPVGPWPPTQGPITQPVYVPTGKPGDYDFTPPFDRAPLGPIALFPGWGHLTPFGIDLAKHKLSGPNPLSSGRYAFDLNYVKSFGSLHSSTRTADQTQTAFFWFIEFPIWNRITSTVLQQEHADVWRSARVLALVNFAMTDGFIACFEAKYHFRFWRPYTAIRRANEDKNSLTEPDSSWLPLLWTSPEVIPPTFFIPPIPEYPSAAAVTSAAAAEVLIQNFDDHNKFVATSASLPNVIRRFSSFTQAAKEAGMSRVYGGIHFRHAVNDGYKQGRGIGRDIARMLPPINQR
jgi:hypothetical protein